MNIYTVLLDDGSVGQVISANAPKTGYGMTVTAQDENGDPIRITGVIKEILEVKIGRRNEKPV
ncbi:MAG: hypothetical protein LBI88_00580 [Deltaproteobacteria bacterium]|nr:hypothetical protein [Deltaproteobacteria bacterium]